MQYSGVKAVNFRNYSPQDVLSRRASGILECMNGGLVVGIHRHGLRGQFVAMI